MKYRVYQGKEQYGRSIDHLETLVLFCSECGYVGTYENNEEIESAKSNHTLYEHSN